MNYALHSDKNSQLERSDMCTWMYTMKFLGNHNYNCPPSQNIPDLEYKTTDTQCYFNVLTKM